MSVADHMELAVKITSRSRRISASLSRSACDCESKTGSKARIFQGLVSNSIQGRKEGVKKEMMNKVMVRWRVSTPALCDRSRQDVPVAAPQSLLYNLETKKSAAIEMELFGGGHVKFTFVYE